jgi:adenylyltransferase/sulfurtransferase
VLGVLPGMIGTIQAAETIKLILGVGKSLAGRLLLVDALTMEHRTVRLRKDPACPACGTRTITELIDYDEFCAGVVVAAASDIGKPRNEVVEITPSELAERLRGGATLDLIDVREPREWEIAHLPSARLVPLGQLAESLATLDSAREIVVMCRSGQRGATAARQLQAAGFRRVSNLAGGLLRWSDEVDPSVPKY